MAEAKRGLVVAIDGPAGAGKTTLARGLADALGIPYLNTGAMYRSLAAEALRREVDPEAGPVLADLARSLRFSIEGDPPSLRVDGRPPGDDLATAEVEAVVSSVAGHPEVRAVLRAEQRRLGAGGAVVEGRDIGTVVFPDADLKIFLQADPAERAARRQAERREGDTAMTDALERRDARDARTNPLVPAPDARVIDSTGRAAENVLSDVLSLVPQGRAPRVAIIGRQNVGKSTLLNRLLGAREAISAAEPGVTRDRLERSVTWRGRTFSAVDTGGYVHAPRGIETLVTEQADRAMAEADVILLVVDATVGAQEEDTTLADRLRRARVPVLLVANKVDSDVQEPQAAELYRLGLGEPVAVSALHGRGAGDLLDRIVALLPPEPHAPQEPQDEREGQSQAEPEGESVREVVVGIVGRPNVGKSSLFNRLVGEGRSVVFEEAGTTRDSVDAVVRWDGQPVRFVDTAGFRRPSRARGVAYYGYVRTVQAIDRSHVAVLVVAADEGVTTEDRKIAARVAEAGRGLVVVANKWDLVPSGERGERFAEVRERVAVFPGASVLRVSAKTGAGVSNVPRALLRAHQAWGRRVGTAEVNRVLQRAQGEHPPPRQTGRIRYGSQVAAGPPRFVLFSPGPVPAAYARFLEHRLREAFDLDGVPIRLTFRRRRPR